MVLAFYRPKALPPEGKELDYERDYRCPVCDFDCPYFMVDGTCQLSADAYFECDETWPFLDNEDEPEFEIDDDILLIEISLEND